MFERDGFPYVWAVSPPEPPKLGSRLRVNESCNQMVCMTIRQFVISVHLLSDYVQS